MNFPLSRPARRLVTKVLLLSLLSPAAGFSAPASSSTVVTAIQTTLRTEGTIVEFWIEGDRSQIVHFPLEGPPRFVLDLPGAQSRLPSHRVGIGAPEISRIRVARHADKIRLVVDGTTGSEGFRNARLVETERGVALVIGDVPLADAPRQSGGALARETDAPRSGDAGGLTAELRDVSAELRAASSELRQVTDELRVAVRGQQSDGALALAAAPPAEVPSGPIAARRAVSEPPTRAARRQVAEPPPVAARRQVAEPPPVAARRQVAEPPAVAAREPVSELPTVSARREIPEPPAVSARAAGARTAATAREGQPPRPEPPLASVTYETVMDWLREGDAVPSFLPGDVLGRGEVHKLRPFFPPGYYHQLLFDDVAIEIQETARFAPHASYAQATLQYGGQTELAADGSIQNYVSGRPFPIDRIRAAEAREGGFMVAWNNIYRWGGSGWRSSDIPMVYLSPGDGSTHDPAYAEVLQGGGHVERSVGMEYHRVYLSHLAHYADQGHTLRVADADEQHFKDWIQFTEPFDMRGMAFVFERFRDPHEPDQVNSYLPTERRVRRLSAKERSDSFVGSEMTMDDFEGFSGRVLDYDWKYVGEKSVMHVQDSKWASSRYHGPQSHLPKDHWQLRRCHVVESRPLYPDHPYGRKLIFFDAETYNIAANVIFDREDRLLKIIYTIYNWPGGAPGDAPEKTVTEWRGSTVINVQNERSLVSWGVGVEIPKMSASKVRRLFSVSNLTGGR